MKIDSIDFVGKGIIDGENIEITFNSNDIQIDYGGSTVPKLTIYPSYDKEKNLFFQMKTINKKEEGEIILPKKDIERLIDAVESIKDKNSTINITINTSSNANAEEIANKLLKSIKNLGI